jgi:hypothetical protein
MAAIRIARSHTVRGVDGVLAKESSLMQLNALFTLGAGRPSNAAGMALALPWVALAPGDAFPAHTHPAALVIAVPTTPAG